MGTHKDKLIEGLKKPEQLKLTADDINTILEEQTDEIFNCNLDLNDQNLKISILGAVIFFVEKQEDLITNQNFLTAIGNKESLNEPAAKHANGNTFTPLGIAIVKNKTEIVKYLLEKDPELLNKTARSGTNKNTLTPLGVAILNNKTEIVKDLLGEHPELLNKTACTFTNGNTLTPLGLAINNDKTEIVKDLLEYGAHEENLGVLINKLDDEQKQKLEKNKQTNKLFYKENTTIKELKDLNEEYFKHLCKQFGAPSFEDQAFQDFISKIITSDQTKSDDIGFYIAEILHKSQPEKFKSLTPHNQLIKLQEPESPFSASENDENTIAAYDQDKGRFKPENIFKFNKNIEYYLTLFLKNPKTGQEILELSKDWILNQEEHKNREKLSQKFSEYCKSPIYALISEQQGQISEQQGQISEQQGQISEQQGQISEQQKKIKDLEQVLPLKRPGNKIRGPRGENDRGSRPRYSQL